MKTLTVTMVYTLKVPNKFKLEELRDGLSVLTKHPEKWMLQVGKKTITTKLETTKLEVK